MAKLFRPLFTYRSGIEDRVLIGAGIRLFFTVHQYRGVSVTARWSCSLSRSLSICSLCFLLRLWFLFIGNQFQKGKSHALSILLGFGLLSGGRIGCTTANKSVQVSVWRGTRIEVGIGC